MTPPLASRQIGRPFADLRNAFAGAAISAYVPDWMLQEPAQLTLEEPLPAYALVGEFAGSCGTLCIGLELGTLCQAYAPDVLARVAPTPVALRDWLDWMLSPWLDVVEKQLGATLSLQSARTHAALSADSLAFAVTLEQGSGHLAVAGTAVEHIAWSDLLQTQPRRRRLSSLRAAAYVLIEAGRFPLGQLRLLIPGAMLRLPGFACMLHLGDLAQGVRLPLRWANEERKMDALEKKDVNPVELVTIPDDPLATPASLDEVTLAVEVVLDRRLLSLAQVEQLHKGSVYRLAGATPGKSVALCCHGRAFAHGELVSVDNQWAVLITECDGDRP